MTCVVLIGLAASNSVAQSPTINEYQGAVKIPDTTENRPYRAINASSNDLKVYLAEIVHKYGGNYAELYNVIQCESSFINTRIGKAGEIGLAQFMPGTWEYFNNLRGTKLNINNPYDQLDMIVWAFNNNLKSHWSCWRKLLTS